MQRRPRTRLQLRLHEQRMNSNNSNSNNINNGNSDSQQQEQMDTDDQQQEDKIEEREQAEEEEEEEEQKVNVVVPDERVEETENETDLHSTTYMSARATNSTLPETADEKESTTRLRHLQRDRPITGNRAPSLCRTSNSQTQNSLDHSKGDETVSNKPHQAKRARIDTENGTASCNYIKMKKPKKKTYFETTKLETAFHYYTNYDVVVQRAGFVRFSHSRNCLCYIDVVHQCFLQFLH